MSVYNEAKFIKSAAGADGFPADRGREVAVAGRSNAGKSSVINALLGRRALARISKTPGRTQLINFFELSEDTRLVDLPGYGFAKVPRAVQEGWRTLMNSYFGNRESLTGLLVVVDIRRSLTELDGQMLAWAEAAGCPVHVLLNKADKLKRGAAATACLEARDGLREVDGATVQLFSSTKKTGLNEARRVLDEMLKP
ncbi:MAG: ribosome biogenesis GTP-binding protein YihA/YsxC [Gammaproteobacteria bacterium]